MEKKFQFFRKLLLLTLLMLGVGSAFGATPMAYDCSEGATWGGYTLEEASLVGGYYEINTPGKLAWFSCFVNNKHYGTVGDKAKLTADIKMNLDDANEADKKYWIPICAGTGGTALDDVTYCKYSGIFDGNDHKISNLYLNSDFLERMNVYYTQNVGFIGAFTGKVTNLTLENIQVLGSGDGGKYVSGGDCVTRPVSIGTLVGWSSGTVEDCIVSGTIVTSGVGQAVGGLVGNAGGGTITRSVSEVAIDASGLAYAGGVVGYTKNTVEIESCVYAGSGVSSEGSAKVGNKTYTSAAGGVVGRQFNGFVTATDVYYDGTNEDGSTIGAIGNGSLGASSTTYGSSDVNQEEVACVLNEGKWNAETETCENAKSDKWSVGFMGLSYEGSDGYMVSFDANGGGFPSGAKKYNVVISGTTITVNGISIPSRDGYAFVGWSRNKNATTPDEDLGEVNGQTTVYAVWNPMIEITFNANGGYFPPDPSTTTKTKLVPTGDPITVEGIVPLPEKYCKIPDSEADDGCGKWMYFRGWSFNNDASVGDAIDLNQLTTYASSENTTLYAIWTEVETYTVTFHAEGHGKTKVAFTETSVQGGGLIDEPAPGFAVPDDGYEFDGWWTEEIGGELFNFNTEITQSIILHAHWKATEYEITCVNAYCDATNELYKMPYNIESDFKFYTPTQTGYTFDGWFYEAQFSTKAEGIKPGATGPLTIYAKWSVATYTITYRAGTGGDGEVLPETVEHGTNYTLKDVSYTRNGYFQDGWSSQENGEKNYELKAKVTITDNLVLYPHWCKGTQYGAVTVTENADGTKTATVNDGYTGSDAVYIPDPIAVDNIVINREFKAGVPSSIMLPFALPEGTNLNGAKFYYLKSVVQEDGKYAWKATMKWIGKDNLDNDILPEANKPYGVICTGTSLTFTLPENETAILQTPQQNTTYYEVSKGTWRFVGAYVYKHWQTGDDELDNGLAYAITAKATASGLKPGDFGKVTDKNYIYPMRSYMRKRDANVKLEPLSSSPQTVRARGASYGLNNIGSEIIEVEFVDDEKTTAIGRMNTITGEIKIDRWFDLKGRHVKNVNRAAKGAYYGKKVFHE